MGILSALLTAPIAPVRLAVWVGELIRDQVDHELYDPGVIRRKIQEVDEARAAGRISPEDAEQLQQELLERLIRPAG
ncbi:gas vesicle protein GvpG [Dactylosporangium salmoneum]|uniref:Gas vesicle protein G n=1 Tax=Dactylosporangium salmoneum TaxID=53361 RepID=A0ABN3H1L2_9ACTN